MYPKLKQEFYNNLGGINVFASEYTTEDAEFLDLRNYGFQRPGALSSRPGLEHHLSLAKSQFLKKPTSLYQFVQTSGESYLIFDSGPTLSAYNSSFFGIMPTMTANATTSALVDFETSRNNVFFANGIRFGFWGGGLNQFSYYNLQRSGATNFTSITLTAVGMTFNTSLTSGITATIQSGLWFSYFEWARGFENIYEGPFYGLNISTDKFGAPVINSGGVVVNVSATIVSRGKWVVYGLTIPTNFGISGVVPYLLRGTSGAPNVSTAVNASVLPLYLTTSAGFTTWHYEFQHLTTSVFLNLDRQSFTLAPKSLEVFNNRLMSANFTGLPSTVWFSEPGEPDNVQPDNFIEFRTYDGDAIVGIQTFQDAFLVFKSKIIFELTGFTRQDFQLRELTREFGLVNDRAKVVFENRLFFADWSGIIEYDGSNFKKISNEIDPYLQNTDVTLLTAVHVKKRREVWFCSSDTIFAYDYFVEAWTIYDRASINSNAGMANIAYGATRSDVSYFGDGTSFYQFNRFGDALSTDFGLAITLIAQTKFHRRLEHTTQEMWRQLYTNWEVPGATQGVTFQLIHDYGTSVYATRSAYVDQFQLRTQYGVSARSLSVKIILQSSQPITFNGYEVEGRYLRSV